MRNTGKFDANNSVKMTQNNLTLTSNNSSRIKFIEVEYSARECSVFRTSQEKSIKVDGFDPVYFFLISDRVALHFHFLPSVKVF